ncbi:hypothetical protein [Parashewanella tropica]|uniref:hypothetical protein n=1 Tax=Parashewanella tropica TaxID=2547970 RepID=UPI0010594A44|nr:hypothetical protein [Parashewanella tropica]
MELTLDGVINTQIKAKDYDPAEEFGTLEIAGSQYSVIKVEGKYQASLLVGYGGPDCLQIIQTIEHFLNNKYGAQPA